MSRRAWDLQGPKIKITPRCDDSILKARGDCIDSSAGPKLVPREVDLPQPLADAAGQGQPRSAFHASGRQVGDLIACAAYGSGDLRVPPGA